MVETESLCPLCTSKEVGVMVEMESLCPLVLWKMWR